VPNRTNIQIHKGNSISETQGCILPNMLLRIAPQMGHESEHALLKLYQVAGAKFLLKVEGF
jgi:hypothetical protein